METLRNPLEHTETHVTNTGSTLNWLRAAVLGANDGIVSTASLVVGVAGASQSHEAIMTAGIAGLMAGALSMGTGEYVSVSTQRDTEHAYIEKERKELEAHPEEELEELAAIYRTKGLSVATSHAVARELTAHNALDAHLQAELGIDRNDLTNPWHAAIASATAFVAGALVPLLVIFFAPEGIRIIATFVGVLIALVLTGALSAYAGGARIVPATARVVLGGAVAMAATFGVGYLFGTTIA